MKAKKVYKCSKLDQALWLIGVLSVLHLAIYLVVQIVSFVRTTNTTNRISIEVCDQAQMLSYDTGYNAIVNSIHVACNRNGL
jgi:hypothetical protein